MSDIFISYKKEDAGRVVRIVEALRAEGFSVWWDHGIAPGAQWDQTIQNQLDAAKAVVAVWSQESRNAPWVKEESAVGKNRGILVPIRIDNVEPPLGFTLIQASDLIGWSGDTKDPRWAHFTAALKGVLSGQKPTGLDAPLRRRRSGLPGWALGAIVAAVIAGIGAAAFLALQPQPSQIAQTPPPASQTASTQPDAVSPAAPRALPSQTGPSQTGPSPTAAGSTTAQSTAVAAPPTAAPSSPQQVTAQEQAMLNQAVQQKTRAAWQAFLVSYPNSPNAARARDALLTCRTEQTEAWGPPSVPMRAPWRGVSETQEQMRTEAGSCAAAKAMARRNAETTCRQVVENQPARHRNARMTLEDAKCNCSQPSAGTHVCVVDMPGLCSYEVLTPKVSEVCG